MQECAHEKERELVSKEKEFLEEAKQQCEENTDTSRDSQVID